MIYGSIRVHMGPYGPIQYGWPEVKQKEKEKNKISDSDFFRGLCPGDMHRPDFYI